MKDVFVLDVNSPAMKEAVSSLDTLLQRCLGKLVDGDFAEGEITLKLCIGVEPEIEWYSSLDEKTGETISKSYEYRKTSIQHKATMQLKQKDERSGCYSDKVEVKEIDGKFVVIPIEDMQTTLF